MTDYLISYSHQNDRFARRLQRRLQREGKTVWRDKTDLRVGDIIDDEIRARLEEYETILLILSPHWVESDWCKGEARVALKIPGKNVVPILYEKCKPPIPLEGREILDIRYAFEPSIKAILQRRPPPIPPWYVRLLRKTGLALPIGGLMILLLAFLAYWYRPSSTKGVFINEPSAKMISVQLENHGGQPSTVVGPYDLQFGGLPVTDTGLVQVDRKSNVIPPRGRLRIDLTTPDLTPVVLPAGYSLSDTEIDALTPKYTVHLNIGVKESNAAAVAQRPVAIPAADIRTFIQPRLPTRRGTDVH